MNKYPVWLNTLVLVILMSGCLLALPNLYGSVPAIQIAHNDGVAYDEARLDEFVRAVENKGVTPEAAYLKDGRVVLRFEAGTDMTPIDQDLRIRFGDDANIAQTLAPKLPEWVRNLGLSPMSLGLDLRGGQHQVLPSGSQLDGLICYFLFQSDYPDHHQRCHIINPRSIRV